jgi:hypothetical protein
MRRKFIRLGRRAGIDNGGSGSTGRRRRGASGLVKRCKNTTHRERKAAPFEKMRTEEHLGTVVSSTVNGNILNQDEILDATIFGGR